METMKVLCVEHCPSSLHTLRWMLEGAGYEVLPASNGQDAVSLFSAQGVHGVLLEYDLPDKTGASVREEMKRINPDIPVLLFSGVGAQTPMLLRFFNAYVRQTAGVTA
jgi:DNA-binding response OmpR family regulator